MSNQMDMFVHPLNAQVRELKRRKQEIQAELKRVNQELQEVIRTSTSVPIGPHLWLCRLPTGAYAIYEVKERRGEETGDAWERIGEIFLVSIDLLEQAVRQLKQETHDA